MKLLRWLRHRKPDKPKKAHAQDDTAAALRRLLSVCPVCSGDLIDHKYALLGHAVYETGAAAGPPVLFDLLKEKRWEEARLHRGFDGSKDIFEAYVLRCEQGSLALLYVQNPVELFHDPFLIAWDSVDPQSALALLGHIREVEWRQLDRRQRCRHKKRGR
ncbi:MAG: hypothetical protein HY046_11540 [Acidobacteria bacterium]|nr:hypothetical protein [Acidobacteriota bacterium]